MIDCNLKKINFNTERKKGRKKEKYVGIFSI